MCDEYGQGAPQSMKSEMLTELACVIDFIRDRELIMIETEHGKASLRNGLFWSGIGK